MNLSNPIYYINGVSNVRASLIGTELGLSSINDLLHFFPYRYIDRTKFYKINELIDNNSDIQIIGRITSLKTIQQKKGSRLIGKLQDETGAMELVWFKGHKWLKDAIKINTPYVIYGKLNHFKGIFSIVHPEMDSLEDYKKKLQTKLQPVYSSTDKLVNSGLSAKIFRGYIQSVLLQIYEQIQESLSTELIVSQGLIGKKEALLKHTFSNIARDVRKSSISFKV